MSDYNFKEDFEKVSDQDLRVYIDQRQKYIPEAVEAAIEELQKRGHVFSEEELISIRQDVQLKAEQEKARDEKIWANGQSFATTDADAPEFYSKRVIRIFSFLFSTLFGSILMAMNLSRTNSKKGVLEVILFGLAFTAFSIWLASVIPGNNNNFGIILNLIGGAILSYFFWNKYIGENTPYRTRSFWIPLAIGVAISALFIYAIYSTRA
jgi:hypothetical protein